MRLEIIIPDQLYSKAENAAKIRGQSTEGFVVEAVRLHITEEPGSGKAEQHLFGPEVLAAIDKGGEEALSGQSLTIEQVNEHFAAKRKIWEQDRAS